MRRTLATPVVLGTALVVALVLAAGCGETTTWSSAIMPAGNVGSTLAPTAPTQRAATPSLATPPTTERSHGSVNQRATAATTAPNTKPKPQSRTTPTDAQQHTSVNAASDSAVNEAGAVSGTGSATLPATVRAGWLPYYDPSGVALQHPTAWTVQPGELGPLVVSLDGSGLDNAGFRRNVNVLEQPLTSGVTAADYRRISLQQIAETGGIVDDSRVAVLGGIPGRQVIWHVTKGGVRTAYLSVWAIKSRVAYLVTYSSDQHNFATPLLDVRRMIASIVLP